MQKFSFFFYPPFFANAHFCTTSFNIFSLKLIQIPFEYGIKIVLHCIIQKCNITFTKITMDLRPLKAYGKVFR